jgi:histidine triad (HIT) family protein
MDDACPFCALAQDTTDRSVIYDDPELLAFMDSRPINPGPLLDIPRVHHDRLCDLDAPVCSRLV